MMIAENRNRRDEPALLGGKLVAHREGNRGKTMKRMVLVGLATLLVAGTLAGHDTWLVPASYRVTPGVPVRVSFNTSMEFPTSDGAAAPDRIARFDVWTSNGVTRPVTGYRVEGKSLVVAVTPGAGMTIVATATRHRLIELEGEVFTEYITEEGLEHVVKARAAAGESNALGRERYSKVAKLVLCEVGGAGKRVPSPELGLDVEIVPLGDPCHVEAGEKFPVRVLFEGKPLEGVVVATGTEGTHGHEYTSQTRTDANGEATVTFPSAGAWFVRTLHMIPNRDFDDADWQSWFSTLTLAVEE